jgi:hypothetical protein
MYHTFDETFLFFGTNPNDSKDLGGEIEFWLGAGAEAEKFIIKKPTCIFIPAGFVHCPLVFRNVKRPFMEILIYGKPALIEHRVDLWPPAYKP